MTLLMLLPLLIAAVGGYFLWRLRAFFLFHPLRTLRTLRGAFTGEGNSFRTLMLALAGTLGVGNITGVAVGLLLGGAGSVFWLLFSALFATVLKYAESTLTAGGEHRDGMIGVIRRRLPGGRFFSAVYALLCLGLAFFLGAGLQCRAVAGAAATLCRIPASVSAACFAAFLAVCFLGGVGKIAEKTAVLIPITTVLYMFLCIFTIFSGISALPSVLHAIFSSAFTPPAAVGGCCGFLLSDAVREGFCRGLLSNEAGAGTSTLAHAGNRATAPAAEGTLGICEVFFDTVLLCMLTAFSLLLGAGDPSLYSDGFSYLYAAFSALPAAVFSPILLFCFFSFAASTSLCWYYYGEIALNTLRKKKKRRTFYPFFFLFSAGVGGVLSELFLVRACDVLLFFAGILSLSALLYGADAVRAETISAGLMTARGERRGERDRRGRARARRRSSLR